MRPFDLVVIGSGPGGQRAAIQASKIGKAVAVVEKQAMVGGVSINTGTIPSKTMREAVLHLSGFYDQAFYGANYHAKENVTMSDLNFRVNRVIENEAAVLQDQLRRNNVELFHGTASFTDPHHLRVENSTGFSVIIVEKRPRLLEFADAEMVEALSYHMRDRRATMRLNEEVESVEELPDGKVAANLGSNKRIVGDALLYAVGRQGNIDRLNLAAAGIEADD